MTDLIFVLSLTCGAPIMENRTFEEWNKTDLQHLEAAKSGCKRIYKQSPCVKVFIKRSRQRDYSVICGKPEKEK